MSSLEDKKTLKEALGGVKTPAKVYDKNQKPDVDVDLSLCTPEELPRMIDIVNRLAKSDAGRETLEIATEGGYKIGFLDAGTNCFGCCFGFKALGLSPNATDEKLISTLCHEARHAGQNQRMDDIPGRDELNVASIVRASRAKEADAQAYAIKACKELEMQGDKGPLATFAKFYPAIYSAYDASFKKHGELNNAVVADTFKGWYDQTTTKQAYEDGYILDPMHDALRHYDKGTDEDTYTFKNNATSEKVVAKIGWTKEGNYLAGEDPKFLDQEKFISIGKRTKKDVINFLTLSMDKGFPVKDISVYDMPVNKDAYNRKTPIMGKAPKTEKPSMSMGGTIDKWQAIIAQKGGRLY